MFLAIEEQVPATLALIKGIKDSGGHQHLSKLTQNLDDPSGLGSFCISAEQEKGRRGDDDGGDRQQYWRRFQSQVMDPYLDGLIACLKGCFCEVGVMAAFGILSPQAATITDDTAHDKLNTLVKKFCSHVDHDTVHNEWASFKKQVVSGPFKDKTQLAILSELSSKYEEYGNLYPTLSLLASIALTVPLSSVNCERDFSTMNRVKTNIRN
uniref:uncharacterized protein LOC109956295 n=1 Tax=Monopterus albus TaxID=43700 RepID=UPI0009B49030|nr:uncharacterized protein LOC109956295 [Monopterus albus]